ncbi:hypothetical protein EFM98_11715 [Propionibacterium freudenreichii]|nr:hypothetical protein [Propionibacterium freudenreichii]SBW75924.1 Hypothetical protein PFR_JS22-1_276 [Propionibacterium freudenreichii]
MHLVGGLAGAPIRWHADRPQPETGGCAVYLRTVLDVIGVIPTVMRGNRGSAMASQSREAGIGQHSRTRQHGTGWGQNGADNPSRPGHTGSKRRRKFQMKGEGVPGLIAVVLIGVVSAGIHGACSSD